MVQANLVPFDDTALSGVDPQTLATLPVGGDLSYAFVADARTMPDQTFVVSSAPNAVAGSDTNLPRSRRSRTTWRSRTMDFFAFAGNVDEDGVFYTSR